MAFPRLLSIQLELAKPKSLEIKALPRETLLICRVRLQIYRLTLPFGDVTPQTLLHRHGPGYIHIWLFAVAVSSVVDLLNFIINFFTTTFYSLKSAVEPLYSGHVL